MSFVLSFFQSHLGGEKVFLQVILDIYSRVWQKGNVFITPWNGKVDSIITGGIYSRVWQKVVIHYIYWTKQVKVHLIEHHLHISSVNYREITTLIQTASNIKLMYSWIFSSDCMCREQNPISNSGSNRRHWLVLFFRPVLHASNHQNESVLDSSGIILCNLKRAIIYLFITIPNKVDSTATLITYHHDESLKLYLYSKPRNHIYSVS